MKNGLSGFLVALLLISTVPALANPIASAPILSEIAWMGTMLSANDEWIELQNPGDAPIDLAGWILEDTKGSLSIKLAGAIPPQSFFLLERTDDTSVPEAVADQIYTGALSNTGVGLRLKDPSGAIIEEVPSWLAGDNATKQTMQKNGNSWCTATATPKAVNGCSTPAPAPIEETPPPEAPPEEIPPEEEVLPEPTPAPETAPAPTGKILLNEIMAGSEKQAERDDWIELLNSTAEPIALSGWTLEITGKDSFVITTEATLAPQEFFIVSHYTSGENSIFKDRPDLNDVKFDLPAFPFEVTLKDPSGAISDQVRFETATEPYHSWEKIENEWKPATQKINLKSSVTASFATPKSINGETITEVTPPPETPAVTPVPAALAPASSSVSIIVPVETPIPVSFVPGTIVFASVIPNPVGADDTGEMITLQNTLSTSIDLSAWTLRDQKGREKNLAGLIMAPKEKKTFSPSIFKLSLRNEDGVLQLRDPAGNTIDTIEWKTAHSGEIIWKEGTKAEGLKVIVTRIVDGDTFVALEGNKSITVRLLGIDTPESVHPYKPIEYYSKKAGEILTSLIENKTVQLIFEDRVTDKYGRYLAYVLLDGENINEKMINEGAAYVYRLFPFKNKERYLELEAEAKRLERGLWANIQLQKLIELKQSLKTEELPEITVEAAENPETPANLCAGTELKIDEILPNPEVGAEEWIRIINPGVEPVCLKGWSLDDEAEKGSKPYSLPEEILQDSATRTFYKSETKINLNNSNDCARLLDPAGNKIDEICYEKTTKASKAKTPRASTGSRKISQPPAPKITPWSLAEGSMEAIVESINPETGEITVLPRMVLSLNKQAMSAQSMEAMVSIGTPLKIEYRSIENGLEAVAISPMPALTTPEPPKKESHFPWQWIFTTGLVGASWISPKTALRVAKKALRV
jgi:endonuclease YncB( thermonuclease family)